MNPKLIPLIVLLPLSVACSGPFRAGAPDAADGGSDDGETIYDSSVVSDSTTVVTDAGQQSTCTATNCVGCCDQGVCQPGTTKPACGTGGETCTACSVDVRYTCLSTQKCGYHPDVSWRVLVTGATVPQKNGTSDWDPNGGAPDPYVDLYCPSTDTNYTSSPTLVDNFAPAWAIGGCTLTTKQLQSSGFAVELYDDDFGVDDAILLKTKVVPKLGELQAGAMTYSINGVTLQIKLTLL